MPLEDREVELPLQSEGSDFNDSDQKVGILGAGIAGLYAALILDSLDIKYEILEASDRTGGRMFTYRFPGGGKYDYYEAGAMRFPLPEKDSQGQYRTGATKRLAKLIEYGPLNEGRDRLKDTLRPFYLQGREGSNPGTHYINGVRAPPFAAQAMGVDEDYIRVGSDAIMNDVIGPFIQMLRQDMETGQKKGWETLMANDSHTLRSYMGTKYIPSAHLGLPPEHPPNNVITWCGLLGIGSDHALSTVVLLSLFLSISTMNGDDAAALQWNCFEGGSETLPKRIEECLNKKGKFVQFKNRVTAISQSHTTIDIPTGSSDPQPSANAEELWDEFVVIHPDKVSADSARLRTRQIEIPSIAVTVNGNETRNYSHVISTIPFSVLRTIDLSGAGLDVMQANALHEAEYFALLKIGVLFKSNWWTTKLGIVGGQSVTDLPVRIIVYPSHGVDSSTPSKVLIAAYTWPGDSLLLGTLAASPKHRDALKELVLRNLAEAHSDLHPEVTYEYLREEFVDMHVQDWVREEHAMGAATIFKPGDYRELYPSLTRPAAGNRLHFAGDAVSTRHGWVIGALDSAWRAVHEYLEVSGQDVKMERFKMVWGETAEWFRKPLPVEATRREA